MKLPNLKLTKSTVGSKSTSIVHRGMGTTSSQESVTSIDSSEPRDEISEGFTEDARFTEEASEPLCASSDLDLPVSDDEPTNHELQSKADVKGWEQLRNTFLFVATECSAINEFRIQNSNTSQNLYMTYKTPYMIIMRKLVPFSTPPIKWL